jgi:hypothetical protein
MNLAVARHLAQMHILKESATTDARGHHVFVMEDETYSELMEAP